MKASNKVPQEDDASGMIQVTGADEQTQQLMMAHKVKRIATPDLLYLGMAMSRRLWGWQDMSETDFIDTVIYTFFNAVGVTLGMAYIRETNRLISSSGQSEKPLSVGFDTSIDHKIAPREKENVAQAPKKKNVDPAPTKEEVADISIDTPIGAQHGELIPWPEDEIKTEKKVSTVITASDVIKAQLK